MLVTGTTTDVGKTWAAASVAAHLRAKGEAVAARKPVQSLAPGGGPTDADILARATGEQPGEVCPRHRWYGIALAPPMAAAALGRPGFTIADLLGELAWPPSIAVGLVEGVGGPASPLADDGDTAALASGLEPDLVVLVSPAGLGALNAVRLSVAALAGPAPIVVLLNRYDDADPTHTANAAWLRDRDDLTVLTSVGALATALSRK